MPRKPATARATRPAATAVTKPTRGATTKKSGFAPVGSKKAFEDSVKKGGGSSNFLVKVPAEDITVRFLTEPDEWVPFYEWWEGQGTTAIKHVIADPDEAPNGVKISKRWATLCVELDDDKVIALQLPNSLATKVNKRWDRFGTVMDRPYTFGKSGEGLGTEYELNNNPKTNDDAEEWAGKYEHEVDLVAMVEAEAAGTTADEDKPAGKSTRRAAAKAAPADDEDEPDDDDAGEFEDDDAADDEAGDEDEAVDMVADIKRAAKSADDGDENAEEAIEYLTEVAAQCEDPPCDPEDFPDSWKSLADHLIKTYDWSGE